MKMLNGGSWSLKFLQLSWISLQVGCQSSPKLNLHLTHVRGIPLKCLLQICVKFLLWNVCLSLWGDTSNSDCRNNWWWWWNSPDDKGVARHKNQAYCAGGWWWHRLHGRQIFVVLLVVLFSCCLSYCAEFNIYCSMQLPEKWALNNQRDIF